MQSLSRYVPPVVLSRSLESLDYEAPVLSIGSDGVRKPCTIPCQRRLLASFLASRNVCKYPIWVTIRFTFELSNKYQYLFILVIERASLEGVGENPAAGWQAASYRLGYFRLCRRFIFQKFLFRSALVLFVSLCELPI